MKHILLATYSYFPYHWGGSEVYVRGLAEYLTEQGNRVTILGGIPVKAMDDCQKIYQDEYLTVGLYEQDGIEVIGCILQQKTEDIYSRYNPVWENAWSGFLKKYWKNKPLDFLHLHANTPLVSAAMVNAFKNYFPGLKTLYSHHVADACPKGTLMYFNQHACNVVPGSYTCTACVMNDRLHLAPPLAKGLAAVWPVGLFGKKFPTALRLKYLTKLSLNGFRHFKNNIDYWHVFSQETAEALERFGLDSNKMILIRHGVPAVFSNTANNGERNKGQQIFAFIGRFRQVKGLHVLLKAWLSLPVDNARCLWVIGGGNDPEPLLQNLINSAKKRPDVNFLGILKEEELRLKLTEIQCVIIPSQVVETGPLAFHEAIASGANVIASDIGGCKELAKFYGEGCEVFPAKNSRILTKRILAFRFCPIKHKPFSRTEHYKKVVAEYDKILCTAPIGATADK